MRSNVEAALFAGKAGYFHMNTVAGKSNFKLGRNDPCPCGSGKKSKKCCGPSGAAGFPAPSKPSTRGTGLPSENLNELAALVQA